MCDIEEIERPASEMLSDLLNMAREMRAELAALRETVDRLETEFGPVARKWGRVAAATDALPGQRWRRSNAVPR